MIFSSLFAVMNANRLLLQGNPIIPAVPSEFGQSTAVQNGGNPPIEPVEPIEPIEPAPSSAAPLDINCNVGYGQAADPADPGYCARKDLFYTVTVDKATFKAGAYGAMAGSDLTFTIPEGTNPPVTQIEGFWLKEEYAAYYATIRVVNNQHTTFGNTMMEFKQFKFK